VPDPETPSGPNGGAAPAQSKAAAAMHEEASKELRDAASRRELIDHLKDVVSVAKAAAAAVEGPTHAIAFAKCIDHMLSIERINITARLQAAATAMLMHTQREAPLIATPDELVGRKQ
jgi:rhamnose utilization protein RhaD (predicted bifunctional aldolase and dehydrogenase)